MGQRTKQRLAQFLFPAATDRWLSVLRIGLGLQIVIYTLSAWADWGLLYSGNGRGLISRELGESILSVDSALVPRFGWLVDAGTSLGLGEATILNLSWLFLLCSGLCLMAGLFSRTAAILASFLHLCATKSGALTSYGMDNFTTIGLFYLMVAPLPDRLSLDRLIRNYPARDASRHGFHRRVLQLHLCIIYFFAGLTKAFGPAWWTGESLWRALTRSPFDVISPSLLVRFGPLLAFAGIAVCLLETGYPFLIWPKKTRAFWLSGILAMHLAIGLTMGLYLFASILIVLNLSAFGTTLREPATAEN